MKINFSKGIAMSVLAVALITLGFSTSAVPAVAAPVSVVKPQSVWSMRGLLTTFAKKEMPVENTIVDNYATVVTLHFGNPRTQREYYSLAISSNPLWTDGKIHEFFVTWLEEGSPVAYFGPFRGNIAQMIKETDRFPKNVRIGTHSALLRVDKEAPSTYTTLPITTSSSSSSSQVDSFELFSRLQIVTIDQVNTYSVQLDGRELKQLRGFPVSEVNALWFAGNQSYIKQRIGAPYRTWNYHLFLVDGNTKSIDEITRPNSVIKDISEDHNLVIWYNSTTRHFTLQNIKTKEEQELLPLIKNQIYEVSISPSGQSIAYTDITPFSRTATSTVSALYKIIVTTGEVIEVKKMEDAKEAFKFSGWVGETPLVNSYDWNIPR